MSFISKASLIINLDGKQCLLNGNKLTKIKKLESISGSRVIVTDFNGALVRVDSVSVDKKYAAAIIEKKIRDSGETDGASKVILLDSKTTAKTTRCLYTAVAVDTFASYCSTAAKHKDHHLIVPLPKLLLKFAKTKGNALNVVLFQSQNYIDLLIVNEGQAIASQRVISSSLDEADWLRAINYLATEIIQISSEIETAISNISWFDWNYEQHCISTNNINLAKKLSLILTLPVEQIPTAKITYQSKSIYSALPTLLTLASSFDSISTPIIKTLYISERALPWAAAFLLGISAALIAMGQHWQQTTQNISQQVQTQQLQIDAKYLTELEIETKVYQSTNQQKQDFDFINNLYQAVALPPIMTMMTDIRNALPNGVRISAVSLKTEKNLNGQIESVGFLVEGRINKPLTKINADLAHIVNKLQQIGYQVQENGLLNKNNYHIFQLLLTVKGVNSEV
ncbi:MAG: hypothetical protein QM479_11665 [Pseudomonadota bacterium]